VTACNLEKSFIFNKQLGLKTTDVLRITYTHAILDEWHLKRFQTTKVTKVSLYTRYKDMKFHKKVVQNVENGGACTNHTRPLLILLYIYNTYNLHGQFWEC